MQIIDLSHSLKLGDLVIEGMMKPELKSIANIKENGYAMTSISIHSHTGTHIDAPAHIIEGTKKLDAFPISKFHGKGIHIPCQEFANKEIPINYLKDFESSIKNTDFIILHSGWSKKWNTAAYYDHFPVLSEEAAHWLTKFHLKGIGADMISMDPIQSQALPVHHLLLGNEILIIENLANLDALEPTTSFTFQCFPIKFDKIDGSPVRALAFVD